VSRNDKGIIAYDRKRKVKIVDNKFNRMAWGCLRCEPVIGGPVNYFSQLLVGKPNFLNLFYTLVDGVQLGKGTHTRPGILQRIKDFSSIPASGTNNPDTG
jgi:hypothetical protein